LKLQFTQNTGARKLKKAIVVESKHNLTNQICAASDKHVQTCKNFIPLNHRVVGQITPCRIFTFRQWNFSGAGRKMFFLEITG